MSVLAGKCCFLAVTSGLYVIPTLGWLIAQVPPEERAVAIPRLANVLEGVIAQQLARTRDGGLRPSRCSAGG
jgi:Tfp pilus assembly pilus retraction ATPase PilT